MKRRRFVSSKDKTTLFPFYLFLNKSQNDVVLNKTAAKQRHFEAVVTNPKQRRFGYLKAGPNRRRFVAFFFSKRRHFGTCGISKKNGRAKTTSFWLKKNDKTSPF